jgi:lipopolysaccharide biosynthesis glycosyltransferase
MKTVTDHLVFSADRRMLGGLHVAALSILQSYASDRDVSFHLFSEDLDDADIDLLKQTLDHAGRDYQLTLESVDGSLFSGFPTLQDSLATYFRLVAPLVLDVDRFLYCDVDTLCQVDLSPLLELDLSGCPIALTPEAGIHASPDPRVAVELGESAGGYYYNAGIMCVDAKKWREEGLTKLCLDYIVERQPTYHDQSALNFVLHGRICSLPEVYNSRTKVRSTWSDLLSSDNGHDHLLHFVDFPKPWSPGGRWVHPWGKLWWQYYRNTEHFRNDQAPNDGKCLRVMMNNCQGYQQMLKDRLLFSMLQTGLIRRVKGM